MTGHIDRAADALTQAGDQVPVTQALQAQQDLATVITSLAQVGGMAAEALTATATQLAADLGTYAGQLSALQQDLVRAASQHARQAGAGTHGAASPAPPRAPAGASSAAGGPSRPVRPSPQAPASRSRAEEALIAEAKAAGHKINAAEVVRIGRTSAGRLVWLEKGSEQAGLGHIMTAARVADFQRAGVAPDSIVDLVFHAATNGTPIGIIGKDRPVYAVTFQGREHRVAVTVGSNGYIVGAAPMSRKGKLKPLP